ncbi:MAG: riboflavin synthase [Candidatus Nanopelagicales bacterium]
MFTGIVEEKGHVVSVEFLDGDAARVTIAGPVVTQDATHGCSIAVDGVCLTVIEQERDNFSADVMRETLRLTTIGLRSPGDEVNLERAVRADTRLSGHIVAGHVDGLAVVTNRTSAPHWEIIRLRVPDELASQVALKGSVAIDGISLTVAGVGVEDDGTHWLEVSLIPETLTATTLGNRDVGAQVNLETDVLAKYVERLMEGRQG